MKKVFLTIAMMAALAASAQIRKTAMTEVVWFDQRITIHDTNGFVMPLAEKNITNLPQMFLTLGLGAPECQSYILVVTDKNTTTFRPSSPEWLRIEEYEGMQIPNHKVVWRKKISPETTTTIPAGGEKVLFLFENWFTEAFILVPIKLTSIGR